jgi:hypothetical protein
MPSGPTYLAWSRGWGIQSFASTTPVERIDRGLYMIEQLGAAALLVFALTL